MELNRLVLPVTVLVTFLALSCGGADSSARSPAAAGTPALDATATCTGPTVSGIQRDGQREFRASPQRVIDPAKTYVATMKTNKGTITIELAAKDAPNTVNNFVFLSCRGFYDGLKFHRYVPDFVIQGGDPRGDGGGGPGYRFDNEISPNLKHDTGVIAMANAGPNTNGSQFYITLSPQPHLDGGYNVFGRVTAGMDVVQALRAGDTIVGIAIEER